MEIKRIENGKHQVQFDLHRMEKEGQLKSKLIEFDNGSSTRVYWNSDYDGSPKTDSNNGLVRRKDD